MMLVPSSQMRKSVALVSSQHLVRVYLASAVATGYDSARSTGTSSGYSMEYINSTGAWERNI